MSSNPNVGVSEALPSQPILSDEATTVITVHGIRTRGGWQKGELGELLNKAGFAHFAYDYGYFNATELFDAKKLQSEIAKFRDDYTRVKQRSKSLPSIIAHSNGTYIAARAMEIYPQIKFDRIIFCGAILRRDFPWSALVNRGQCNAILNLHSEGDDIVGWSEWAIPDAGDSGRKGFTDVCANLFQIGHNELDHSGQFYALNYSETWIPFLRGENVELVAPLPPAQPNPKFKRRRRIGRAIKFGCPPLAIAIAVYFYWPASPPAYSEPFDKFCAQLLAAEAQGQPAIDRFFETNENRPFISWEATVLGVVTEPRPHYIVRPNDEQWRGKVRVIAYITTGFQPTTKPEEKKQITISGKIGGPLDPPVNAFLRDCSSTD